MYVLYDYLFSAIFIMTYFWFLYMKKNAFFSIHSKVQQ